MKIKHLILAFGGASLLAACNLDEYPYGFYSEDNFYKTEADAESAVNYIYDAINYIEYSRSIVFLGDMNTDEWSRKATPRRPTRSWTDGRSTISRPTPRSAISTSTPTSRSTVPTP